jgi:hypothetical protein
VPYRYLFLCALFSNEKLRVLKERTAIFEENFVKHEDLARSMINEGLV